MPSLFQLLPLLLLLLVPTSSSIYQPMQYFNTTYDKIQLLALSPDDTTILISSANSLTLFNTFGQPILTFPSTHSTLICGIQWPINSGPITTDISGTIIIWSPNMTQILKQYSASALTYSTALGNLQSQNLIILAVQTILKTLTYKFINNQLIPYNNYTAPFLGISISGGYLLSTFPSSNQFQYLSLINPKKYIYQVNDSLIMINGNQQDIEGRFIATSILGSSSITEAVQVFIDGYQQIFHGENSDANWVDYCSNSAFVIARDNQVIEVWEYLNRIAGRVDNILSITVEKVVCSRNYLIGISDTNVLGIAKATKKVSTW